MKAHWITKNPLIRADSLWIYQWQLAVVKIFKEIFLSESQEKFTNESTKPLAIYQNLLC